MPWIENVSLEDIKKGRHFDAGPNSMLIQILDHDMEFPKPFHDFKEVHQFKFLDLEETGFTNLGTGSWTDMSEFIISDDQAKDLVHLLKHAFEQRMNVIVHCHAGVCRSGAVCEIGHLIGFADTDKFRSPNKLVLKKMHQFVAQKQQG